MGLATIDPHSHKVQTKFYKISKFGVKIPDSKPRYSDLKMSKFTKKCMAIRTQSEHSVRMALHFFVNRPFPSSFVPLFQNESKCETFLMKMSSACSFILIQIKVIFITMVSHLKQRHKGTRKWPIPTFSISQSKLA